MRNHFSITFLSKCLVFVGSMVQGVLVARLLGPEGKGLMSYMQANLSFLCLFFGFALPNGVVYFAANNKISIDKILGTSYCILGFALVSLFAVLGLGHMFSRFDFIFPAGYENSFYIAYFCLSFIFTFISAIYFSVLAGRTQFKLLNFIDILSVVLRLSIFGFAYLNRQRLNLGFETIFLVDLLLVFLQFIFCISIGHAVLKLPVQMKLSWKTDMRPLLIYTLPLYVSVVISFLYFRFDFWVVEHIRGLRALGVYSVAAGGAHLLTFFPSTINTVMSPYLAKTEPHERHAIFSQLSKLNFALLLMSAIFIFVVAGRLVPMLYGADFADAVGPLKILVWGYLIISVKTLFVLYNQINVKLHENIVSEIIVLVLLMALNFLLVPRFGIAGASWSMLVANAFSLAFILIRFKARMQLPILPCFLITKKDVFQLISLQQPVQDQL